MSPTMDDVARQVGVSKSTVSLALNNKPGISAELKQSILQAAADLGYRLGRVRPAPRTTTLRTVAVVHSEPDLKPVGNPDPTGLYLNYLNGIRAFAQNSNLSLTLLADYREGEAQGLAFHLLHNGKPSFDGLILMGWSARKENQLVQQIMQNRIPAVALSRYWSELAISTVGPSYQQQVQLAIDHLAEVGHRQIAFLARDDSHRFDWYSWRLAAYQAAMVQLTGSVNNCVTIVGATGAEAVDTLLAQRPDITAIFAVNDDFAIEVISGLRAKGLSVPQDMSVIGQDDMAAFLHPGLALTTVGFPHFEVGYLAADLLQRQMDTEALAYGNLWVRSYLIDRNSCSAPRC